MSKKSKNIISIKELVKATSIASGKTQKDILETLKALDDVIVDSLSQATEEIPVEVKLLPSGMSAISEYAPAHEGRNPITGETITIDAKLRVKGKVYGAMKKAVNA